MHLLQTTADIRLRSASFGGQVGVITTQAFDANTGRLLGLCATPHSGSCDGATENFSYSWDTIPAFAGTNLTARADTYGNSGDTILNWSALKNADERCGGRVP